MDLEINNDLRTYNNRLRSRLHEFMNIQATLCLSEFYKYIGPSRNEQFMVLDITLDLKKYIDKFTGLKMTSRIANGARELLN